MILEVNLFCRCSNLPPQYGLNPIVGHPDHGYPATVFTWIIPQMNSAISCTKYCIQFRKFFQLYEGIRLLEKSRYIIKRRGSGSTPLIFTRNICYMRLTILVIKSIFFTNIVQLTNRRTKFNVPKKFDILPH